MCESSPPTIDRIRTMFAFVVAVCLPVANVWTSGRLDLVVKNTLCSPVTDASPSIIQAALGPTSQRGRLQTLVYMMFFFFFCFFCPIASLSYLRKLAVHNGWCHLFYKPADYDHFVGHGPLIHPEGGGYLLGELRHEAG